jgi:hypothetical protein
MLASKVISQCTHVMRKAIVGSCVVHNGKFLKKSYEALDGPCRALNVLIRLLKGLTRPSKGLIRPLKDLLYGL